MKNILNEPGIFWFEDDEENKFNGTIIEKDNHYLLKTDIETEYFEKYFKKNIIIGQINETRITLYENHLWNPFKTLTFSIDYIFKNYNYESNLNFKGVTLKFYNLEEWIGIDKTFEKKFEENGYKIIPKFEPFTFKQNRFEIIFALGSSLKFTKTSFCAESNYMIQIFYNSAAHIKTILGDIKLLKRFLTFVMYNKTEIKSMDCTIDNEFRLFNKIDVYSKSFNENIEYINPFNITVKFDEIENKQEIFNKGVGNN